MTVIRSLIRSSKAQAPSRFKLGYPLLSLRGGTKGTGVWRCYKNVKWAGESNKNKDVPAQIIYNIQLPHLQYTLGAFASRF
jgi:hypothetical protein